MLIQHVLRRRVGKWAFRLIEFGLAYVPYKPVKGQALIDFLSDCPCVLHYEYDIGTASLTPYKPTFDGSKTSQELES